MKLNYKKSQSLIFPEFIDTTSSKVSVFIRQNIIEKENVDEISGEKYIYYEYDEAKLSKKEYEKYLSELEIVDICQQRADIDYIALMMGIDLEDIYE